MKNKLLSLILALSMVLSFAGCGMSEEEVEAVKKESYQQGFDEGQTAGFDEGRTEGYTIGFSDGRAKGYETGFADGREKGYKTGFDDGKAKVASASVSSTPAYSNSNNSQVVYTTATGSKYHRGSCHHLKYSAYETTVAQAQAAGYGACKNCNPPR